MSTVVTPALRAEPGQVQLGDVVDLHYGVHRQLRGVPFTVDVLGPDGRFTTRFGMISHAVDRQPAIERVDFEDAQLMWPEPLVTSEGPDRVQLPDGEGSYVGRLCHLGATEPELPCVLLLIGNPSLELLESCEPCRGVDPGMPLGVGATSMLAWQMSHGTAVLHLPTVNEVATEDIVLQQFDGTTWKDVSNMEVASITHNASAQRIEVVAESDVLVGQRICLTHAPAVACALVPPTTW